MKLNIIATAIAVLPLLALAEPIADPMITAAAKLESREPKNVCGGIQGKLCPKRQHCEYNGKRKPQYPDQQGVCVKNNCKPQTVCADGLKDCKTTTLFYGGCYDTCTPQTFTPPPCPTPTQSSTKPSATPCGGFAGTPCAKGYKCVDDPRDNCDPNKGGADCIGWCKPAGRPCGGRGGAACPLGQKCVDDPTDSCPGVQADCAAYCVPK